MNAIINEIKVEIGVRAAVWKSTRVAGWRLWLSALLIRMAERVGRCQITAKVWTK
jgi:hypothetical protein